MISILTALVAAYLIGAIPFGLLIARISGVKDIRDTGSGNIGATNVLRSLGMKVAIWVYICDIGKGALTVFLAPLLSQNLLEPDVYWVLVGLATILGHIFPVYLHFKGGKGVATIFGVLLVLLPIETLLAGLVFLLIVWWTRYVSLASIAAGLTFPIAVTIERTLLNQGGSDVLWALTVFIGLLVPITHIPNIKRLIAGTENKFERSSSKGAARG
jgi:acyl phosphate:glycerol-3-phosphate acyltransferase